MFDPPLPAIGWSSPPLSEGISICMNHLPPSISNVSIWKIKAPVWHSGLTRNQTVQIEKVRKTAFKIILGNSYTNYETACTLLFVEPLEFRRIQPCINFAKRDLKREDTLFSRTGAQPKTRSKPKLVNEYRCRTSRYQKSSMPYLSSLLNKLSWSNNWAM